MQVVRVFGAMFFGLLIVLLAGCGDDATTSTCGDGRCSAGESCPADCATSPQCGDGTCGGEETCSSCSQDCGPCTSNCGDGVCTGSETPVACPNDCACVAHTDCSSDEICIGGSCNSAWGRVYRFTVDSASIAASKPDGSPWDTTAVAPDPFVNIYAGDTFIGRTTIYQDNYLPVWNEVADIALTGSGVDIGFYLWDEDISDHDYVTGMVGTERQWLNIVRTQSGISEVLESGTLFRVIASPL